MQILIIYIVLLIIPLLSTFVINFGLENFKNKKNKRKLTGCEVAHEILDSVNLDKVYVVATRANLNNYNSKRKVIKLSDEVFDENTIFGITIGASKAVEATMDKPNNKVMHTRDSLADMMTIGMIASYILLILGLVLNIFDLMYLALGLNALNFIYNAVMFKNEEKIIDKTIKVITKDGYIDKDEKNDALNILNKYKFTYFANMINCLSRIVDLLFPNN